MLFLSDQTRQCFGMIDLVSSFTALAPWLVLLMGVVCFLAGLIRGFTGFGLSAVLVAIIAVFVAPIELLPIALLLEAAATVFLLNTTWRDADWGVVSMFIVGSVLGYPTGLALTIALDPQVSKIVALLLIFGLVLALLMGWVPPMKKTRLPLGLAGFTASFVSGIAGVGGLVYAAVFLAMNLPARVMRATMIVYLGVSLTYSITVQSVLGVMDEVALSRAAVMVPVTLLGVWIGKMFFAPETEKYYRRICMGFLVVVSLAGLGRLVLL
ncbi:MAG: sulfite exporter TauE/SafE family protein [Pseudomonadota bacterium]